MHVQPDCPPVSGNLRALEQIFSNLINNALQAMGEEGGRLAIKAQVVQVASGRQSVEVSVADTGPGIPVDIQERIFQPFFTTERNGTGLGLAITKRIVTAHKGNIRLESFPSGTVFYVQIPVALDEV
jgi:signal transduction histidine kinase